MKNRCVILFFTSMLLMTGCTGKENTAVKDTLAGVESVETSTPLQSTAGAVYKAEGASELLEDVNDYKCYSLEDLLDTDESLISSICNIKINGDTHNFSFGGSKTLPDKIVWVNKVSDALYEKIIIDKNAYIKDNCYDFMLYYTSLVGEDENALNDTINRKFVLTTEDFEELSWLSSAIDSMNDVTDMASDVNNMQTEYEAGLLRAGGLKDVEGLGLVELSYYARANKFPDFISYAWVFDDVSYKDGKEAIMLVYDDLGINVYFDNRDTYTHEDTDEKRFTGEFVYTSPILNEDIYEIAMTDKFGNLKSQDITFESNKYELKGDSLVVDGVAYVFNRIGSYVECEKRKQDYIASATEKQESEWLSSFCYYGSKEENSFNVLVLPYDESSPAIEFMNVSYDVLNIIYKAVRDDMLIRN